MYRCVYVYMYVNGYLSLFVCLFMCVSICACVHACVCVSMNTQKTKTYSYTCKHYLVLSLSSTSNSQMRSNKFEFVARNICQLLLLMKLGSLKLTTEDEHWGNILFTEDYS